MARLPKPAQNWFSYYKNVPRLICLLICGITTAFCPSFFETDVIYHQIVYFSYILRRTQNFQKITHFLFDRPEILLQFEIGVGLYPWVSLVSPFVIMFEQKCWEINVSGNSSLSNLNRVFFENFVTWIYERYWCHKTKRK